jgi:hypothetical protein
VKSAHVVEAYPTGLGIGGDDRGDSLLSGQALMKPGVNVRIGSTSEARFHKAAHYARQRWGTPSRQMRRCRSRRNGALWKCPLQSARH